MEWPTPENVSSGDENQTAAPDHPHSGAYYELWSHQSQQMQALIQRVSKASVRVDGKVVAQINTGLLVLAAVMKTKQPPQTTHTAVLTTNPGAIGYSRCRH